MRLGTSEPIVFGLSLENPQCRLAISLTHAYPAYPWNSMVVVTKGSCTQDPKKAGQLRRQRKRRKRCCLHFEVRSFQPNSGRNAPSLPSLPRWGALRFRRHDAEQWNDGVQQVQRHRWRGAPRGGSELRQWSLVSCGGLNYGDLKRQEVEIICSR